MSNFVEIKDKDGVTLGQLPVSKEGGRLRNIVYITSTDEYEKPAWLKFVRVRGVGGGGGGGGCAATSASTSSVGYGGGSGSYFEKFISAVDLAESETVTIGNGGAAGSNANGSSGGVTSFGSHCTAPGGAPGFAGPANANAYSPGGGDGGEAGTGGDINLAGNAAKSPRVINNELIVFGYGASSALCSDAAADFNSNGSPGKEYGGGGNGGHSLPSNAARAGGAGAPGIVIIEEYE